MLSREKPEQERLLKNSDAGETKSQNRSSVQNLWEKINRRDKN